MKLKDAVIRAARTAAQVFVATLVVVSPAADLLGVKEKAVAQATSALSALLFAVSTGVVALVQNLAEDNTGVSAPK